MSYGGHIYILSNKHNTTLYLGVTSDLVSRVIEHRDKTYPKSFSARYNCNKLVFFSFFDNIESAIEEEKRLKGGTRIQKVKLIESINPNWEDLYLKEVEYW